MKFVYLLKTINNKFLKIGISNNPIIRMENIQVNCPYKLKMMHIVPAYCDLSEARSVEWRIKKVLSNSNVRNCGEWYDFKHCIAIERMMNEFSIEAKKDYILDENYEEKIESVMDILKKENEIMSELTQNTLAWLQWRAEGIGASDAPVILGKSKFKTKLKLWDEKFTKEINKEESDNTFIQDKGHRLEAWARPGLEFSTGLTWRPAIFTHSTYEFIRASLDGWNGEVCEGWECKFMGKEIFETLSNETLTDIERIPYQYLDQICQQFFVTGAKAISLTGIIEEKIDEVKTLKQYTLRIVRTEVFEEYINKTMVPELFAFWKSVQEGVRPEADASDVLPINDEVFKGLLENYELLKEVEAKAVKEAKDGKKLIEKHELRNHNKMECSGFLLTDVNGKRTVDYKAAFEAFVGWIINMKTSAPMDEMYANIIQFPDEPNLEPYTKTGKASFKITIPKKKVDEEILDAPNHAPENKINKLVDDQETRQYIENWKRPDTNRMPSGWKTKGNEWRLDYVKKHVKKIEDAIHKAEFDKIEYYLMDLNKPGPAPITNTEPEQIGGITFQ